MADADTSAASASRLVVVYDGECPFCASYVRLMALRRNVGAVELVDARSGDPRVRALWADGFDLNAGMVAIHGGTVYHGSDALALVSALSSEQGVAQRLLARVLRSPRRARLLYPAMKTGRRIALRALGRSDLAPALD